MLHTICTSNITDTNVLLLSTTKVVTKLIERNIGHKGRDRGIKIRIALHWKDLHNDIARLGELRCGTELKRSVVNGLER